MTFRNVQDEVSIAAKLRNKKYINNLVNAYLI